MVTSGFYEATWLDNNGNTMCHQIPHLHILSKYFQHSNAIDKHNHVHQFLLQLEKHWVMEDGYFCIITTLFGMVITDCWKAYKFHLGNCHQHKNISINAFVDLLCHDLLSNQLSNVMVEEATLIIPGTPPDCMMRSADDRHAVAPVVSAVQVVACDNTIISSLTHSNDSMASKLELLSHQLTKNEESEIRSDPTFKSYVRTKRMRCKAWQCGKKTTFKCSKCVHTVALCNSNVCLDWHRSKILMGNAGLIDK